MTSKISSDSIRGFQKKVMDWWEENARDLPWRRDPSPYNVLVSEVMLQQTQVSRVVPKYNEFTKAFPNMESLASAETKELLKVWSGLGYNRRAIWLREAARQIIENGEFPQSMDELRRLKGVGPYTSRSILIFAFNRDLAAVDTNIRRVLIACGFANEEMTACQLQEVADILLLTGRSRDWHNALMDYGSDVLPARSTGIAPTSSQSKFSGSSRQVRGAIIRFLQNVESLSIDQLRLQLEEEGIHSKGLDSVLNSLIQEGFIDSIGEHSFRITEC
ncbi:MAG: Fe-S cluster assembly protein HesB [Candidatus Thorarchaeota archaeon]